MKTVTVELPKRNLQFTSQVTDSDGFFFLSLVFNTEERKLLEEGRHQEAAIALKERYDKRLAAAQDSEERKQIEEQANMEIANYIYHQIDSNREIRSAVSSRLIECFPDLPSSLVFYENANRFGIRLDVAEIMEFFVQIVGVALADIGQETKPLAKLAKNYAISGYGKLEKPSLIVNPEGESHANPREVEIAQIKSRLAQLEKMESQNASAVG